jgi:hypothetical protein
MFTLLLALFCIPLEFVLLFQSPNDGQGGKDTQKCNLKEEIQQDSDGRRKGGEMAFESNYKLISKDERRLRQAGRQRGHVPRIIPLNPRTPPSTQTREAVSIGLKIKYTFLMLPGDREAAIERLKQWDLWGPLMICLVFSLGIGIEANQSYAYDSFINVFIIYWVGAALAGANCRLLGNRGYSFCDTAPSSSPSASSGIVWFPWQ